MSRKLLLIAAVGLVAAVLPGSPASAQATRTWVSGVGDDANPCSRTAPCKTWAGAISKTSAGGEIDALDPGGFGGLTITKAITLDGGGGQVASVLVSGTNGITVAAGAGDIVILRNLRFNGLSSGLNGVLFNSGAMLNVENCDIFGFTQAAIGVASSATGRLNVKNTTLVNSMAGISFTGTAGMSGSVDHTYMNNDNTGIISSAGSPNFTITNSVIAGGGTGINAGSAATRFDVDSSTIEGTGTALNASVSGALIRASNNNLDNNSVNFAIAGGATIQSTGNNRIGGGSGAPNGTYTQQ